MRALLIFVASMLAILVGAATLSGCQSYRTDASGQHYHQGDRWEMYRLDKNYNPVRVK